MTEAIKKRRLGFFIMLSFIGINPILGNQSSQSEQRASQKSFLASHRPFPSSGSSSPDHTQTSANSTLKKKSRFQSLKNYLRPSAPTGIGEPTLTSKATLNRISTQLGQFSTLIQLKREHLIRQAHIHELEEVCRKEHPTSEPRKCAELVGRQRINTLASAKTQAKKVCHTADLSQMDSCFKDIFNNLHRSFSLAKRKWPTICNPASRHTRIETELTQEAFSNRYAKIDLLRDCVIAMKNSLPKKK